MMWIRSMMSNSRWSEMCLFCLQKPMKKMKDNFIGKLVDAFAIDSRRVQFLVKWKMDDIKKNTNKQIDFLENCLYYFVNPYI